MNKRPSSRSNSNSNAKPPAKTHPSSSTSSSPRPAADRPRYEAFSAQGGASRPRKRPALAEQEMSPPDFSDLEGAHYVYGRHAILELLEANPKRVQKLYVAEHAGIDKRLESIISLCEANRIRWNKVPRQKIDNIVRYHAETFSDDEEAFNPSSAQGVAVMVTAQPLLDLDELIEKAKTQTTQLIIALDEVTDGRNIGAILRVADAVGACGVILPKHRTGGLSPLASKTAVGADQHLPIAQVTNLSHALDTLKEAGYWTVGTLCPNTKSPKKETFNDVQHYKEINYNTPIVLVVGSEDKGLRPTVAKHCDFRVHIPMFGQVDSLNVSTATAVLAYEIVQQQRDAFQNARVEKEALQH
ncbi:MAG: 23S rRNA (guanosine(2251)-2'-O)-methyltransferase RlmB [Vampirovibrio sp.]